MNKVPVVWATLARHLRPGTLVRDAALLGAIGALAAFALLYAGRLPFDRTVFAAGLDYAGQAAGRLPNGLTLDTLDGFSVGADRDESAGPMDLTRQATSVMTYDAADASAAARLFGGVLKDGTGQPTGILLDEAAAVRIGVRPGDRVVLTSNAVDEALILPVAGIIAPYHRVGDYGNGGLVVAPRALLPESFTGAVAGSTTYFAANPPPQAIGKWQDVLATLGEGVALGPLVVGLIVLGLALWSAGLARVSSGLVAGLRTPLTLVVDLGASPRLGNGFVELLVVLLAATAGSVAAVGARQLILMWTSFYVTAPQLLAVVATLCLVAWVIAVAAHRNPSTASHRHQNATGPRTRR